MEIRNISSTSTNDGYEVPVSDLKEQKVSESNYTELEPIPENYRTYDELKTKKKNISKEFHLGMKTWISFISTIFLFSVLSAALTYTIIYFNKDQPGSNIVVDEDDIKFREVSNLRFSKIVTKCPAGWNTYTTWCYKGYTTKKIWQQARDVGLSMGADLLSVHNENETNILKNQFISSKYWIGLNDINIEGQFSWSDGSDFDYTNWRPYEPTDSGQNEDCTAMDGGSGTWNDDNCFVPWNFICKIDRALNCGQGSWFFYNGSCYGFNPSSSTKNWHEARQACKGNDADLVTIHSKNEHDFLRSLMLENILWIGLNNFKNSGEWKWIDGTNPDYLSWQFPQIFNETNKCKGISRIFRGNWVNENCNDKNGYVCEKRP